MQRSVIANRVRLGAVSLGISGVLFVLYPAARPFSDEASLKGAEAFGSSAWILAHVFAMLGFILPALGVLGLYLLLQETPVERLGLTALTLIWVGAGLTLPFYGAEAFGLHAIGQRAFSEHSNAVLTLANDVRTGPGLMMGVAGLVLLAVGTTMLALTVWISSALPRWSGFPLAIGFILFVPQFFAAQPLRVAHGLLVCAGCLWTAAGMWRGSQP